MSSFGGYWYIEYIINLRDGGADKQKDATAGITAQYGKTARPYPDGDVYHKISSKQFFCKPGG